MIVDEDGQRIGRFDTSDTDWRPGDVFEIDEHPWRIVEILPEVSTMVAYNAVWVAAPPVDDELDDLPVGSYPDAVR